MKEVVIILQARLGSTRLPKKVLLPIQGIPILSHCIRRLTKINNDVPVIVATSVLKEDYAVLQNKREQLEAQLASFDNIEAAGDAVGAGVHIQGERREVVILCVYEGVDPVALEEHGIVWFVVGRR